MPSSQARAPRRGDPNDRFQTLRVSRTAIEWRQLARRLGRCPRRKEGRGDDPQSRRAAYAKPSSVARVVVTRTPREPATPVVAKHSPRRLTKFRCLLSPGSLLVAPARACRSKASSPGLLVRLDAKAALRQGLEIRPRRPLRVSCERER
jgi:hypothetical protein